MKLNKLIAAIVALGLLITAPANAASVQTTSTWKHGKFRNNLSVSGNLAVTGTSTLTGAVTQSGNLTVGGNLAVTGTTTLTGVATGTAANVLTHAATSGLRILDTGADHRISINATSNEAADRALSIPALGGNDTLMTLGTAQAVTGVKTMSGANVINVANTGLTLLDTGGDHSTQLKQNSNEAANRTLNIPALGGNDTIACIGQAQTFSAVQTFTLAPVLSSATLTANGDTITIQDLGNANIVQSEGAQTINGVKTFGSAPVITGGLPASQIQTGSAKRQVQTIRLAPVTGAAADANVYRGIIAFGRAGTVTRITYGADTVPTSGTNVIAVEKNSFSGNTMLSTATVSLNSAAIATTATLTGTGADLGLTATEVVACEYNAGTQDVDAQNVYVSVEFEPTDF